MGLKTKTLTSFKRFKSERINYDNLKLFNELFLLIKLDLKKKRKKSDEKPEKILIINTCIIGDFISSLPALKYFLDKNKGADIDLFVSPVTETLAKRIKGIQRVFVAKSIFNRNLEKIKESKPLLSDYDLILVMRLGKDTDKLLKNIQYNEIRSYLGPYLRYVFHLARNLSNKKNIKQWSEVNFEIVGEKGLNKNKMNLDDVFDFNKSDFDKIKRLQFLKETRGKKRVIIHASSEWPIRSWSNQKWIELLKKIHQLGKFQFIFVGNTKEEKKHFDFISKNLNFKIFSVIEKLNLKETTLLMKRCNYFIGIDSGPRHLAHLLDLPSVCLLGPGPQIYKPLNNKAITINKSNCRCTSLFCYRKETCMEKINVDDVFREFKKLYNKVSN